MKHFEDLSATDLLYFAENIETFNITEKFDGSNLIIGRDEHGLYTRRENKEKFYNPDDYNLSFFTNYQKIALSAILDAEDTINDILEIGQEVSAEVIVGTRPNVVLYHGSIETVHIVLFTDANIRTTGATKSVQLLATNGYTKSQIKSKSYGYRVSTLHEHTAELISADTIKRRITGFLHSRQNVHGVSLSVKDILDWPLNRRYPINFDVPWKEAKETFKVLRTKYRSILKSTKLEIIDSVVTNRNLSHGINEGFVVSNDSISFKLVNQEVFLKAKNFIWKYRDMLKSARKAAGKIETLDDAEYLKRKYTKILDKYLAHQSDIFRVNKPGTFEIIRDQEVKARDKSAFIIAFQEAEEIENEIRRNIKRKQ